MTGNTKLSGRTWTRVNCKCVEMSPSGGVGTLLFISGPHLPELLRQAQNSWRWKTRPISGVSSLFLLSPPSLASVSSVFILLFKIKSPHSILLQLFFIVQILVCGSIVSILAKTWKSEEKKTVAMVTNNELRRTRVNRWKETLVNLMEKRKDRRKQARRETASQTGDVRPQENVFDPFMSASTVQQPRVCFFEESSSGFIILHKPWEESQSFQSLSTRSS